MILVHSINLRHPYSSCDPVSLIPPPVFLLHLLSPTTFSPPYPIALPRSLFVSPCLPFPPLSLQPSLDERLPRIWACSRTISAIPKLLTSLFHSLSITVSHLLLLLPSPPPVHLSFLSTNAHLEDLDLSFNYLEATGAASLAEVCCYHRQNKIGLILI